jgi:hypothetical protein
MENAVRVAAVLAKLPNDLEPAALLAIFDAPLTKGGMDNDALGHAYYTVYYGYVKPPLSPVARPANLSFRELYAQKPKPKSPSLRVVEQTEPAVYASDVCDAVLQYDGVVPPHVFCQAIRNVHPHELKNDYYHRDEICGYPFDTYLGMVNARLQEYFSANRDLDDVLSGIKKCLCLRMLSNSMYHYRDHPTELDPDPAIAKLMQFYTLTDFLHESSPEAFDSHAHMIRKYKQLKELIDEFIKPEFKLFLRLTQCRFDEIVRVEPEDFVVRIRDVRSDAVHVLPHNLPMLQAFVSSRNRPRPPRMSSNDMVHKVQSHFLLPRTAFDEGIRFMKVLMDRLEKRELTLADTYDDLFKIYELTTEALRSLHERNMHRDRDDEEFFAMMKQMDRYKRKYRRTGLNPSMVDWSQFTVAGPARSPSPLTRKRSRSPSRSPSRSRSAKRRSLNGSARTKPKPKPKPKTKPKTKRSKKVLIRK